MELLAPIKAARRAGLRHVADNREGIRRVRRGKGFAYFTQRGKRIKDRRALQRIKSMAIPPAWKKVWISPSPNGHLQATGIDARGRKQYRYHPQWTVMRNEVKFDTMRAFGEALTIIRCRVRRHLACNGCPKEKVLACVVRLMDQALIRVGNDEYARDNESYGLTTLRRSHVKVNGHQIHFRFKGKSGQKVDLTVEDPRAAKIVRHCQELPGQEVFEYIDDAGRNRDIDSGHVNEYLFELTGQRLTAKDFRTWGGTVVAAAALHACGACPSADGQSRSALEREVKRRCVEAVKKAAEVLGNRVATCRKFYVHPKLPDCYVDGRLERAFKLAARQKSLPELSKQERAVLQLLKMIEAG